jgi:hypothetical protein
VLTAIALLLVGFLAASVVLARGLSGAGVERERVRALLEAQAAGDAQTVLAALPRCRRESACADLVTRRTAALARPGAVQILAYTPGRAGGHLGAHPQHRELPVADLRRRIARAPFR